MIQCSARCCAVYLFSVCATIVAALVVEERICDLSRENVPCVICLHGRDSGKLTGDSRLVKSFERLQNFMEHVSSQAQRA